MGEIFYRLGPVRHPAVWRHQIGVGGIHLKANEFFSLNIP